MASLNDRRGKMKRTRRQGNTIVEYLLPAGLIVIATIGGWNLLSNSLASNFSSLKEDMQSQISATSKQKELAQLAQQVQTGQNEQIEDLMNQVGGAEGAISISELSEKIQTMGANGGTEILAAQLESYIEQLKASGELSDDQLGILEKLANEGHKLASAEKALEDAASNGQGTVTYDGQTYSLADFSQQFGFDNGVGIDAVKGMGSGSAMEKLKPFMQLYEQANASGALSDPAVNSQIQNLSSQIAALSDLAKWNYNSSGTDKGYAYVTAMEQIGVQDPAGTISDTTDGKSGEICGVGSGTDSGTQCN